MNIFREFVKKPGRKVVIATHAKVIYTQTDVIYKIENGFVQAVTEESALSGHGDIPEQIQTTPANDNKTGVFRAQLRYALKRTQKDKGRKRVVLFLLGFTIACTLLSSVMGERFAGDQAELVNEIAENEILVINNTLPEWNMRSNFDFFMSFDESALLSFSRIDGVQSTYPLYEFPATGYSRPEHITSASLALYRNGENIGNFSFTEEDNQAYTVLPYWSWQNYEKKAIATNSDTQSGVYISEVFARELGIQDVNGTIIRFDACVPFAIFESTLTSSDGETAPFDGDIFIKKTFEFPIEGILDASVVNRYSMGGDNVIYMEFVCMEEAFKVAQNENSLREKESPWAPSAVILEVSDLSLLDHVRQKLLALDPNYSVIIPVQDSQAMIQMVEGVRNWATGISIALLIIISFFMFVVYLNQTDARKYEIAMLRANGFRKSEVAGLLCIEALIDALRVALIALILSLIVRFAFNFIFYLPLFDFGWQSILLLLGVSVITISLPTLIILTRINRFNPDKLMRN
ncbi:MAG: ABC transporter permease [Oscillospiraceae bacterium]|nr:ABC transporter permease [Oscillospiraceae bacterium]